MPAGKRVTVFLLMFMLSGGTFALANSAMVCPPMAAGIVQPEPACCGDTCGCEVRNASAVNFNAVFNAGQQTLSFDFLKDKSALADLNAAEPSTASTDLIPPRHPSKAKIYDLYSDYRL